MVILVNTGLPPISLQYQAAASLAYLEDPYPTQSYSIRISECAQLRKDYQPVYTSWSSVGGSGAGWSSRCPVPSGLPSRVKPPASFCENTVPTPSKSRDCGPCYPDLNTGTVQLYYRPIRTTDGNICSTTGITLAPTPTGNGPNTTLVDDHTFTSPTIYILYQTLQATNFRFSQNVGKVNTSGILTIPPSDLFGVVSEVTRLPFNLANLPPNQIPYSAYVEGSNGGNGSIFCNEYRPNLALPTQIDELNPLWSTCSYVPQFGTLLDPPYTLTSQIAGMASPNFTVAPPSEPTTPASPGPTIAPASATSTSEDISPAVPSSVSATPAQEQKSTSLPDPSFLSKKFLQRLAEVEGRQCWRCRH
ncbi:hypothetical protein MMC25_008196 [Agyrium rufum]|nr:hypothetical protein [Agyrium rufum]